MRRLILAAVAAAALLAVPALTSAKTNVYYPACAGGGAPEIKPRSVIVACGDGNFQLAKMKWSSWGSSKAVGGFSDRVANAGLTVFGTYNLAAVTITNAHGGG